MWSIINSLRYTLFVSFTIPLHYAGFTQVDCEKIPAGYNGICHLFYDSGAIESSIEVVDGKPIRKGKTFHEDGTLSSQMDMVESFFQDYQALYVVYSPSGEEEFKIQLTNGNGTCMLYNSTDGTTINGYYSDNKASDVWTISDNHGVSINSLNMKDLEVKEFSTFEELMTETAKILMQILELSTTTTVIETSIDGEYDPYEGDEVLRKAVSEAYSSQALTVEDLKVLQIPSSSVPLDVEAVFQGGPRALQLFINENVIYPNDAVDQNISGKVVVTFVINKDGHISHPRISKSVHESLDKEALRICLSMPNWIPAEQGGLKVTSIQSIPIIFNLTD